MHYIWSNLKTSRKGNQTLHVLNKTEKNDNMGLLDGYWKQIYQELSPLVLPVKPYTCNCPSSLSKNKGGGVL